MNIAQSDDNTFAITDLSLEDLATIWHILNVGRGMSIDEYITQHIEDPTTRHYFGSKPAAIKKVMESRTGSNILDGAYDLWILIDKYLANEVAEKYGNKQKQAVSTNPCGEIPLGEQLVVTGDNPVTMDVLIEAAHRQAVRMQKGSNRGKK